MSERGGGVGGEQFTRVPRDIMAESLLLCVFECGWVGVGVGVGVRVWVGGSNVFLAFV